MSRSISEIFNGMVSEKESLATLSGLTGGTESGMTPYQKLLADVNSASRVAIWRLVFFIVAAAQWFHESLWDIFKTEVTEKADEAISGNIDWYLRKIYEFQYGGDYTYVLVDGKFQWTEVVEDDRVVKYAAIVELDGELLIKIAGQDNEKPVKLASEIVNAFTAYVDKFRIAGTICNVISNDADLLTYNIEVYFDALRGFNTVKTNVENAISTYLATRDFNGRFVIQRFVDAIQAVTGVEDVAVISLQAKYGDLDYTDTGRQYFPNAGYMEVDGGVSLGTVVENQDRSITTTNGSGVTIKYIPYE